MTDDKTSFVVYTDIKETLDDLTDEQVATLFRGMVDYQISGIDPGFSGVLKYVFIPIRQQMDKNNRKWERTKAARTESGRKGGIASGESRRKKSEANEANASKFTDNFINEANEANEAVNVNVNVNVDVDGNVNVSDDMPDAASLSSSLIEYLNQQTGSKYKMTESTENRIGELLDAGYTEADMIAVIEKKVAEWKGDAKMRGYLRPRTLFGDKFEEYLRAPVPLAVEAKQEKRETVEKLRKQRAEKADALQAIEDSLETLRASPGGVKSNPEEWRILKEQKAITEDSIAMIDRKIERLGK